MPRPSVDILLLFGSLATWSTLRQNVPGSEVREWHWPAINVGIFLNVHCQLPQQLPSKPSGLQRPFKPRSAILLPWLYVTFMMEVLVHKEQQSRSQPVRHQTPFSPERTFSGATPGLFSISEVQNFCWFCKENLNCWILQPHSWI